MAKIKLSSEIGRMVDCSQADDRRMIRLVRERPLLYARNNMPVASFYTQVKTLWEEIASEMNWSVADVRRKWSHIRNSYSRHLRNEMHGARTGRGRIVSRWYLADELEFLREHMATDTRTSMYSGYAPSFLEMDMAEHNAVEPVDVKPFIHNHWFSLATPQTPQCLDTKFPPISQYHNDDSSNSQAFDADENSSFFQFFRGIYNDYQELTSKKQRLFKRQCLNFLHDLLDEEESQQNFSDSGETSLIKITDTVSVNEDNKDKVYESAEIILPTD